jgi:hypothetical protein
VAGPELMGGGGGSRDPRARCMYWREAEHARKVEARNDWLQRGRTGGSPEAIYGGRPPMEKKSDD